MSPLRRLVILRALPGAGKSTWIRQHLRPPYVVCSADHYFERNGGYCFNPAELGAAHSACQVNALRAMKAGHPLIVLDNTNVQRSDFAIYAEMAALFGYDVEEVALFDGGCTDEQLAERNVHGVPLEIIQGMREKWEK